MFKTIINRARRDIKTTSPHKSESLDKKTPENPHKSNQELKRKTASAAGTLKPSADATTVRKMVPGSSATASRDTQFSFKDQESDGKATQFNAIVGNSLSPKGHRANFEGQKAQGESFQFNGMMSDDAYAAALKRSIPDGRK